MKARDLMVPVKAHLMPGDGLEEFVRQVRTVRACEETRGVRTLPVLDSRGKLVGVLSMKDILKAIHPPYLFMDGLSQFTWDGMLESMAKKITGKKVSDLMTKQVVSVNQDHPLMECVDYMLRHSISIIPVIDDLGRLIGIIYESDIFFAVADGLLGGKS